MATSTKRLIGLVAAVAMFATLAAGCDQAAIKANQQQVVMQQAEIAKMQKEIAALKSGQTPAYPVASPTATPAPGTPASCDRRILRSATRSGGDSYSTGDLKRALGYYRDAVTACPSDAAAQLNLARTYEALGNTTDAVDHYRKAAAASASDSRDQKAIKAAKLALARLTRSH